MGDFQRPLDDAGLMAILTSIGTQVREARQGRGWFLSDMADRIELSPSVVCRLELARREPSLHQVITVCAVLNKRFSNVMRNAEDEAFPLGHAPWDLDF